MYPTNNKKLLDWLLQVVDLCEPRSIYFCNGSEDEFNDLSELLVERGTFTRLSNKKRPNSFIAFSDPMDTARIEDKTYICTRSKSDAGATNNWVDPNEMKIALSHLFRHSMRGRTLYVVPFAMGPVGSPVLQYGIQLTDSAYVVVNMHYMARMGTQVLEELGEFGDFACCLHSVGYPLNDDRPDVSWPCQPDNIYISHFPESNEVWSFGSGYGGNALLAKKCVALRLASFKAKSEHWLAEHMLLMKVTTPTGDIHYFAGAFPSACGKTNLAMMSPSLAGWKVETLGDDICWISIGQDGRLYATNPETGFFGVAQGTNRTTNPNVIKAISHDTIFTNTGLTEFGDAWWEGLEDDPGSFITDWRGSRFASSDQDKRKTAAHLNSRFTVRATQLRNLSSNWQDPKGVPLSGIIFGGRRSSLVPLVSHARSWSHGVFLGSTLASETTAAAMGSIGMLRRDPFAMLPFCGYNMVDYFAHWLDFAESDKLVLPEIFLVNWFRKNESGEYVWPGYGENIRIIAWMIERISGRIGAVDTPFGFVPEGNDINIDGLAITNKELNSILCADREQSLSEVQEIRHFYEKLGSGVPKQLLRELEIFEEKATNLS